MLKPQKNKVHKVIACKKQVGKNACKRNVVDRRQLEGG